MNNLMNIINLVIFSILEHIVIIVFFFYLNANIFLNIMNYIIRNQVFGELHHYTIK